MARRELNWAILGCGEIATQMCRAFRAAGRRPYSVANRTHQRAEAFAREYGIEKVYDSIDGMFADPRVDIVYIATPHNTHYPYVKRALEAGKHALVEKSIVLNSRELDDLAALAAQKKRMLGEAMTIWHMPLYRELRQILSSGTLGRVQIITMNFGSFKPYDMANRFFNMDLAGGALLDIGVYALSIVRGFMDIAPGEIASLWNPSPTGSDESSVILLKNASGQLATVALSMHSKQPKRAMISCEKGYVEIMEYPRADRAVITDAATGTHREIVAGAAENALYYEVLDMEEAVACGDPSLLRLEETRDVMAIMTRLRKDWGLKYPGEVW